MAKKTFTKDLQDQIDFATKLAIDINADRLKLEQKVEILTDALKLIKKELENINDTANIIAIVDKALKQASYAIT